MGRPKTRTKEVQKKARITPLNEDEWGDVVVIHPNGLYERHEIASSLANMQALVGGYVERIPHFDKFEGRDCIALGNEDGRLLHAPYNNRATIEWGKCIGRSTPVLVGPIVILTGEARKGWMR